MKKLGSGWQYDVYDIGNGRVQKRSRSLSFSLGCRIACDTGSLAGLFRSMKNARKAAFRSIGYIKSLPADFDYEIFGNPQFSGDLNYSQDHAIPLGEFFERSLLEEQKAAVDKYIELIHYMWRYGLGDVVYNFTLNNGINKKGRVIQLDIGELQANKADVEHTILNKQWLKQSSYLHLPEGELKKYFKERMEMQITQESLAALWGR